MTLLLLLSPLLLEISVRVSGDLNCSGRVKQFGANLVHLAVIVLTLTWACRGKRLFRQCWYKLDVFEPLAAASWLQALQTGSITDHDTHFFWSFF